MDQHSVVHTLINLIIKEALRQTHLRQIGKNPRFFDPERSVSLRDVNLQMWPGFKASACTYDKGATMVIENVFKFMSMESCLERIKYLERQAPTQDDYERAVIREFRGKSIIANWGNKRAYIVSDVVFNQCPTSHYFQTNNGQKVSIFSYFRDVYNMQIREKNQPLFQTKMGQKEVFLPPEFCTIDGVPQSMKKDPRKMRNVLEATRRTPE